jgi:DNA-3-methyladenine glycosylase
MPYKPLPRKFYLRDSLTVAKNLLGKILIKRDGNKLLTGKIVETEAYMGDLDPGSHAYKKFTDRNKVMYETGGLAYVYFIYGNYYCFNVVCGAKGIANAVLIRAVEPVEGIDVMKVNRKNTENPHDLTNGPAKLCMAFKIDKKFYGRDLTSDKEIFISESEINTEFEILLSKRIGLSNGADLPYRFFIKDNPFVTKHKLNKNFLN